MLKCVYIMGNYNNAAACIPSWKFHDEKRNSTISGLMAIFNELQTFLLHKFYRLQDTGKVLKLAETKL